MSLRYTSVPRLPQLKESSVSFRQDTEATNETHLIIWRRTEILQIN